MPVRMAVPKELVSGECRVALDPTMAERFTKLGVEILLEKGAGLSAFFPDEAYAKSSRLVDDAKALYAEADVVFKVQGPTLEEVELLRDGSTLLAVLQPHRNPDVVKRLRDKNITSFAMELIPRISRAQSMDVLSSQAAVAGYYVALRAAILASGFFPMLTTAAGTIRPSKVVIVGAGVAGLQAIATAKRLGAVVEAFDVRPATKEQVESLGGKFVEVPMTDEEKKANDGVYAKEMSDDYKRRQGELVAKHAKAADIVITTALIPGKQAPILLEADVVAGMKPGAVIVDIAAESGGNCPLTRPGAAFTTDGGVTVVGFTNLPGMVAADASSLYAKNLLTFLSLMLTKEGFSLNLEDDLLAATLITHQGVLRFGQAA